MSRRSDLHNKGVRDSIIGLISGYFGVKAMDLVTTKLYEMTPDRVKEQERRASPGVAYELAARDLAGRVGLQLTSSKESEIASAFHYGLGFTAGEMYVLLRRNTSLGPVTSAAAPALLLFLGVDEGLTPLMGWSAPAEAYPLATHVRGLVGHLVLGATIAATAEVLSRALDS